MPCVIIIFIIIIIIKQTLKAHINCKRVSLMERADVAN